MGPGRTAQTYPAKDSVRPLGASWSDGPDGPVANTGRPLLVNDQTRDEAQHVRPHDAEQLMGIEAGTAAGPGITAKNRLQAIGGGWEINVTSMLLKHLKPRSVQAYTSMHLAKLAASATATDMEQGEHFINLLQGDTENKIRIPHGARTGDEAAELPIPAGDYSIGTVSNSKESATGKWLQVTFNHASQDKIWRTLGVTAGLKQPAKPFEDCFCTACATSNARGKGLKHTQYSIFMVHQPRPTSG